MTVKKDVIQMICWLGNRCQNYA